MDLEIFKAINGFAAQNDFFEDCLRFVAINAEVMFAAVLAAAFLAQGRWRSKSARHGIVAAGLAALLALAVAHMIGGFWDRPRPYEAHPGIVHLFIPVSTDPSFPSDHATAAFAIAVSIFLRNRRFGLITLAMATVIGLSRVVVGTHYPSDILGGAVLGTLAALALWTPPIRGYLRRFAMELSAFYDRLSNRALGALGRDAGISRAG
jgi:undecaprenyl-diphosphatase